MLRHMPTASNLHLLSIDLGSAPNSLRAVLELGPSDVEHWLERAKLQGAPLAIVCGPDCVDLYSSEAGRRAAFKPLLETLWALGRNLEGFERVRTREAHGHAAVRHLLRQAAGLDSTEHGLSYVACIAQAEAQAMRFQTMSSSLAELFQLATATADRSDAETELSSVSSTRASRRLEALGAERIVEEEVAAFRAAAASDEAARATLPAPATLRPSLSPYAADEPSSHIRLRVSPFQSLVAVSSSRRSG
jgi:hypothetical protein